MNTLKSHLTIIFLIFLESCQSTPQKFEGQQCQPVFSFDEAHEIVLDKSFCRCRDYVVSKEFIGSPTHTVVRKPLSECDQVLGYVPKTYLQYVNFLEYVRQQINESGETYLQEGIIGEAAESVRASEAGREVHSSSADTGNH